MPRALAAGPHSPPALLSGDEALDGWTGGVPGAQMCVRAYGHRVSVVDLVCACACGERLFGVINIIIEIEITPPTRVLRQFIPRRWWGGRAAACFRAGSSHYAKGRGPCVRSGGEGRGCWEHRCFLHALSYNSSSQRGAQYILPLYSLFLGFLDSTQRVRVLRVLILNIQ